MPNWVWGVAFLVAYVVLTQWLLPKLGVPTWRSQGCAESRRKVVPRADAPENHDNDSADWISREPVVNSWRDPPIAWTSRSLCSRLARSAKSRSFAWISRRRRDRARRAMGRTMQARRSLPRDPARSSHCGVPSPARYRCQRSGLQLLRR